MSSRKKRTKLRAARRKAAGAPTILIQSEMANIYSNSSVAGRLQVAQQSMNNYAWQAQPPGAWVDDTFGSYNGSSFRPIEVIRFQLGHVEVRLTRYLSTDPNIEPSEWSLHVDTHGFEERMNDPNFAGWPPEQLARTFCGLEPVSAQTSSTTNSLAAVSGDASV